MSRLSTRPAVAHLHRLDGTGPGDRMYQRWTSFRTLLTARLILTPVGGADLPDLRALKADPRVFAVMLGGVRSWAETAEELAEDVMFWGAHGYGIWAVRERVGQRLRRHHRSAGPAGRPRGRAALRAMAGGAGPRPGARGGVRRAALRPRAGAARAHHRRGAGEQLRLPLRARRHRHDRVRRLHPGRLRHGAA